MVAEDVGDHLGYLSLADLRRSKVTAKRIGDEKLRIRVDVKFVGSAPADGLERKGNHLVATPGDS